MKKINKNSKCECEDCDGIQEDIVYDRVKDKLMSVCQYCAEKIVDKTAPEYTEYCPNCGCRFGVN